MSYASAASDATRRSPRVLLAEAVPAVNAGEAAIMHGLAACIHEAVPDAYVSVLSENPVADAAEYAALGVRVVNCRLLGTHSSRRRWLRLGGELAETGALVALGLACRLGLKPSVVSRVTPGWAREYMIADVILFGHDNMIVGPRLSPRFLARALFCRLSGKPSMMPSGSYGPFQGLWSTGAARWLLRQYGAVALRERRSFEYCCSLLPRSHVPTPLLLADPAFLMEPLSPPADLLQRLGLYGHPEGVVIGLTPSYGSTVDQAFVVTEGSCLGGSRDAHDSVLADFIHHVVNVYDARVVLIPHSVSASGPDDRSACRNLKDRLRDESRVAVLDVTLRPRELKGLIAKLDFLVAERVHSAVAALDMGVPLLLLSHADDYRAVGILHTVFGDAECYYDVRSVRLNTLCQHFDEQFAKRVMLSNRLGERREAVRAMARATGDCIGGVLYKHECQ